MDLRKIEFDVGVRTPVSRRIGSSTDDTIIHIDFQNSLFKKLYFDNHNYLHDLAHEERGVL